MNWIWNVRLTDPATKILNPFTNRFKSKSSLSQYTNKHISVSEGRKKEEKFDFGEHTNDGAKKKYTQNGNSHAKATISNWEEFQTSIKLFIWLLVYFYFRIGTIWKRIRVNKIDFTSTKRSKTKIETKMRSNWKLKEEWSARLVHNSYMEKDEEIIMLHLCGT